MEESWGVTPPNFQLPIGLQLKSVTINFLSRDGEERRTKQLWG